MVRRSFNNTINPVEVSIGIERLLVADYPQAWSPARIDLDSLPSGFVDLGAVVEDTPSFQVRTEKFELKTGIPMVTQYQAVQGMEATLQASLHSNSWRKVQYAFGNFTAVSSAISVATIGSVTNGGGVFSLSTTPATPIAVGQQIILASAASAFDRADTFETRVTSVSGGLVYACKPPLPSGAAAGWNVGLYGVNYVEQFIGGRQIKQYVLLGVTDFIDGAQVVHQLMKCVAAPEFTEEFRPDANGRIPLAFNAFGVETSVNSCTELLVAKRYYFPPTSEICGV